MKVVFDHQIFARQRYGGISRYFHEIAGRIPLLEGDDVEIFAPFHVNEYIRTPDSLGSRGVKVSKVRGATLAIGLVDLALGQVFIRPKRNVAIFHETYYSRKSYSPTSAKRVITVYDMIHERMAGAFAQTDKTSEVKRLAVARADHVICISESTRSDLVEIMDVPIEKTSVVYLGHSLTSAIAEPPTEPRVGRPYLLYVGARATYKNFENLLVAYSSSDALRRDFSLVCFGGGKFNARELSLMKSLGLRSDAVVWLEGDDSVLSNLYSSASAFVYPSLYEGFGIPPLEAMSHGCPVVCTNASSLPEVVGDAAELFDPRQPDDIRDAIERVVSSQERSNDLVSRGYLQIQQFSWQRCALETLNVYKRLLPDRSL
jgi:glycosyltransferase involved in cell wall biosynthesis